MPTPSIKDCLDLIRANDVLPDWSDAQLVNALHKSLQDAAFTYTIDEAGNLDGLVLARWDAEDSLHIIAMVCKGKMWTLLKYLRRVFPKTKHITYYRSKRDLEFKQLTLNNYV